MGWWVGWLVGCACCFAVLMIVALLVICQVNYPKFSRFFHKRRITIFLFPGEWVFGITACDIWTLANFWFCSASIFNLCAVTWDRYIAVTSPLRYASRMSTQRVIKMIIGAWTFSLAASFINFHGLKISKTRKLCEIQGLPFSFVIYSFIFVYLLPIIAIIFVNTKLWLITSRQMSKIQAQIISLAMMSIPDTTKTAPSKRQTNGNLTSKSAIKTFRTFLVLIGSFVLCITPFFMLIFFDSLFKLPGFVLYVAVILMYVNSATNPWIYGIWNKEFRNCVILAFQKRFRRTRNVVTQQN